MRKNKRLAKKMMVVPLTAALVTGNIAPWMADYVPGYPVGITAYADDIQSERLVINLNELKTDFAEDTGIKASISGDVYRISIKGSQKYLIKGSNYINDTYVDVYMEINGDADVYFDNVYIKNDNGQVKSTTVGDLGKKYSVEGAIPPIVVAGNNIKISGNLAIDTFHAREDNWYYAAGAMYFMTSCSINDADIAANGDFVFYNITPKDVNFDNDSTILCAGSVNNTVHVYAPELDGKYIKGYRLYQNKKVIKEYVSDNALINYGDKFSLLIGDDDLYDEIEIMADDGSSYLYKRYNMVDEVDQNNLIEKIFSKEEDASVFPTDIAVHTNYAFVGDKIVRRAADHTDKGWELNENNEGVKKCIYCGKEMDSCVHKEPKEIDHDGNYEAYRREYALYDNIFHLEQKDNIDYMYVDLSGVINNEKYKSIEISLFGCDEIDSGVLTKYKGDYYKYFYNQYTMGYDKDGKRLFNAKYKTGSDNNGVYVYVPPAEKTQWLYVEVRGNELLSHDFLEVPVTPYGSESLVKKGTEPLDATCNSPGYIANICDVCGLTVSRELSADTSGKHNVVYHEAVPSTCTATGNIEYWECKDCNVNYSDEECRHVITGDVTIPVKEHSYSLNRLKSQNISYHIQVCDDCGYVKQNSESSHHFTKKYGREICDCGFIRPYIASEHEKVVYGTQEVLKATGLEDSGLSPENVTYQWYMKLTQDEYNQDELSDTQKYIKFEGATDDTYVTNPDINAGKYTYICVITSDGYSCATTVKELEVMKKEPSSDFYTFVLNKGGIYTGDAYATELSPDENINGLGVITVKYQRIDENGNEIGEAVANPPVNAGSYKVIASIAEGINYSAKDIELGITVIDKVMPEYDVPETQVIGCDNTVKDIMLPDGFEVMDESQILNVGNDNIVRLIYTPEDTVNYYTVNDIEMTVRVNPHEFKAEVVEDRYIKTPAACEKKGIYHKSCNICGAAAIADEDVFEIPATGHTWDEGKVTKEPAVDSEGIKTYTCKSCDKTREEMIPKKPKPTEPVTEPTTEPTTEKPTQEPTTEPTMEPTTEPVTEPTTEPITEPTMEPVTEPTTGNSTERPTKTPTNSETEVTTEPVTEPMTEPATKPGADPTTEPTTEPATKPVQKPVKKGDKVTDDKKTGKYIVTDTKKRTVTYMSPYKKKSGNVKVSSYVKIRKKTYKVTAIYKNAFKNNRYVTKVTMGDSVTSIGANAFSGASKLKNVTIGKNVISIGSSAFKRCDSLKTITLPDKVVKIGAYSFSGCKKLKTITIKSQKMTSKTISDNAFKGLTGLTSVKVPKKSLEAYKKLFKRKGLSSGTAKIKFWM